MKSKLLLVAVLLVGLVAGIIWQQSAINKLKAENEQLREKSNQTDALLAENERLSQDRIDPAELQRLRDNQSELIRLRGQVSQLKRQVQDATTAATTPAKTTQESVATKTEWSDLPVQTFMANVNASVGWNQSLVTGGWKMPSGKRALVFVQPMQESEANQVTVRTRIVAMPENMLSALGFDSLKTDDRLSMRGKTYSAAQTENMFKSLEQTDGVDLVSAPVVTTLSGRQAQVRITEFHTTSSGQNYTTGPTIDIIPTVAADGQTVELIVSAQINYPKAQPGQ